MTAKKTLSPLAARKRPARLALAAMRQGPWSDGKKVLEGEDLVAARRRISVGLAGMKDVRATAAEMHKSNSMTLLKLMRRRPAAHGLPEALGALLRQKSDEMHASAMKHIPGSKEHLISFRRLAKRLGVLDRRDLPLDGERQAIIRSILEAGHVRLRADCTVLASMGRHGVEVTLPRGTRLDLEERSDHRDFVMTDGTPVRLAEKDLGPAPLLFRSGAHVKRPSARRPRVISSRGLSVCGAGCRSH